MSTETRLLQRLDEVTDYKQLREIFSQLANQATEPGDGRQLIVSIDEAVRRIEQERARDDVELQSFELRYSEFKGQQRGVLGWFRRHIPFTETRRIEVQHKGSIADQRAEVLADNLIIARAQMLKQSLLPSAERLLGESVERWKSQIRQYELIGRISDYAKVIEALTDEVAVSSEFVNEIQAEIDAFAGADFSSKEDQRCQAEDLASARRELAVFKSELREELAIRDGAIKRAGGLVNEELLNSSHEFYEVTETLNAWHEGSQIAGVAAAKAVEFSTLIEQAQDLPDKIETGANQVQRLQTDRERLEREFESARQRLQRVERKLDEADVPGDDADQSVDRMSVKYQRRKEECESIRHQLDETTRALKASSDCQKSYEAELRNARATLPRILTELERELNQYFHFVETTKFHSQVQMLQSSWLLGRMMPAAVPDWAANDPSAIGDDASDQASRLAEAIKQDEHELKKLRSAAQIERDRQWTRRCYELLGERVAQRVAGAE